MSDQQEANHPLELAARPAKRRKFYRQPIEDENDPKGLDIADGTPLEHPYVDTPGTTNGPSSDDGVLALEDSHLSIAEILRRRKAAQKRRGGIEFSNASRERENTTHLANDKHSSSIKSAIINEAVDRFAPQTGQVADVDKHMMAYIDSEIAKRRQGRDHITLTPHGHSSGDVLSSGPNLEAASRRQPAALGRLHEIDLGPDATLRNIERTEAAHRRLEGDPSSTEDGEGKIRLRRDGKPWRGRRRRNSEDVKRDKLVEEVLRETRLEIYDEPEADHGNDDQAADDRIAEQFRREFMEAISSRRQRTSATAKAAKGAKVEDRPKGPKLGGSRSARAAMREQQEKANKK